MKVGDLVRLSVDHFDIPDRALGVITEMKYDKAARDSDIWKLAAKIHWTHNELYPMWIWTEQLRLLSRKK